MAHADAPLEITLPATLRPGGSAPGPLSFAYVRDMTEADIVAILNVPLANKPRPLAEIRAAHHNLAKLLAAGLSKVEASKITARSTHSIASLEQDPAFQELVAHYRKVGEEQVADVAGQIFDLNQAFIAELQDRIESEPENFSNKEILQAIETLSDRSGFGATKTVRTVDVASVINELKEKREGERRGRVLAPEEVAA